MTPEPTGHTSGHDPARGPRPPHPREAGTRALLDALAIGDPDDVLKLGDMLLGLGRRAFGVLLFIAIPAALIPGVAGVISAPVVILVGAQLLIGLRKPWLPRFLAQRGPHRAAVIRFDKFLSPWLGRLEHLIKPRLTAFLDHRIASAISGLLLIVLGLLLSLPIPFTNPVFGGLLLLFALALLERDGALMLIAWISGTIAVATFGVLSGNLAAMTARWMESLM